LIDALLIYLNETHLPAKCLIKDNGIPWHYALIFKSRILHWHYGFITNL